VWVLAAAMGAVLRAGADQGGPAAPGPADAAAEVGDERARAHAAYQRGASAYKSGAFAAAARAFAEADDLSPHELTLSQALKSAERADDPVLAMEIAERAERRGGPLSDAAERLRAQSLGRVGRLTPRCPSAEPCEARIDGQPVTPGRGRWVLVGDRTVEIVVPERAGDQTVGRMARFMVRVRAGVDLVVPETDVLAPAAPPTAGAAQPRPTQAGPPVAPPPRDEPSAPAASGIAPAWFWMGVGITAVLAGVTIASGVDALAKNDAFQEVPTPEAESDGRDAQTRTNILVGATAASAVAAAAIGVFAVDWTGAPAKATASYRTAVVLGPGGAVLHGRF
jgi:hypothetical protein